MNLYYKRHEREHEVLPALPPTQQSALRSASQSRSALRSEREQCCNYLHHQKEEWPTIPEKHCVSTSNRIWVSVILDFVCCLHITKHHLSLIFFSLSIAAVSRHSPERKTRLGSAVNLQVIPSICQQAAEATATSVPKSNPWATAALWLHPWRQHQMPAWGFSRIKTRKEREKKTMQVRLEY